MDEQRAWIRARRKRRLRIMAVILSVCLLVTNYPDILENLAVWAAGSQSGDDTLYVSRFAKLPEEVQEQTVPVGTPLRELTLPDTLEAVIVVQDGEELSEDMEEEPEEPLEDAEEEPEEPLEDAEEEPLEDAEEEPEESSEDVGEEPEEPSENTGEEPETPSGDTGEEQETPSGDTGEESAAPSGDTGEESANPFEDTGEEQANPSEDTEGETGGIDMQTEDSAETEDAGGFDGAEENVGAKAGVPAAAEDAVMARETHTVALPRYGSAHVIAAENLENTQDAATREETVLMEGITWKSTPSYDGDTEGDYLFTAVLPEGYGLMEGVSCPEIRVTVYEETENLVTAYAALSVEEAAYAAKKSDDSNFSFISSDNAGDRYKLRFLWKTTSRVDDCATAVGCETSWVGLRVPGMAEQRYKFDKKILTDTATTYVLGEFTLPYTYEQSTEIFPTELGIYSTLSLISGQFKGQVILQAYNYISGEWESFYICNNLGATTAFIGGLNPNATASWHKIDQTLNLVRYIDVDQEDLRINGRGADPIKKSWPVVCMDRFGVVVTNASRGWSGSWKFEAGNQSDAASAGATLTGDMEEFTLTVSKGIEGLSGVSSLTAEVGYSAPSANSVFQMSIGVDKTYCILRYVDSKGLIYQDKVNKGSTYRVKDMRTVKTEREVSPWKGHTFAGTYTGGDEKTYKPGDTIIVDEPVNFYMDWEPATYKVTFDGQIDQNGDRTLAQNEIYTIDMTYMEKGAKDAPIPQQAPDRYRFGGWVGKVGEKEILFFDEKGKPFNKWSGDENTVLTVRWLLTDIKYNLDPGEDAWCSWEYFTLINPSGAGDLTLASSDLTLPKEEDRIFRYGYTFLGWFTQPEGGEQFTEYTKVPLVDTTYYAHWKPKEVNVTFDANGGVFAAGGNTSVKVHYEQPYKEVAESFPVPLRKDYDFVGWGYSRNTTIRYVLKENSEFLETEDFTLYAIWLPNNLSVYLDPDGGSVTPARLTAIPGEFTERLPEPMLEGYTFLGWKCLNPPKWIPSNTIYPKNSKMYISPEINASCTLTAQWEKTQYYVYIFSNCGEGSRSLKYTFDTSVTLPEKPYEREGYVFAGWNTKSDGTGTAYADQAVLPGTLGNLDLYAQWKPNTYSVNFDPNGGVFDDSADSSKEVIYTENYGSLPVPKRERYDFLGWYTEPERGDREVTETTKVTNSGTHTLYARWKYTYFTLSFDLRGGVGGADCAFGNMEGVAEESIHQPKGIKLPKAAPIRAGWEFLGFSKVNGKDTVDESDYRWNEISGYTPSVVTGSTEETVTLYAVWHTDQPVVRYMPNTGGAGTDVVNLPEETFLEEGKATVSSQKPERSGYEFLGWALVPDGKPLYGQPEAGTEIIYSAVSVTLYAVWRADEPQSEEWECKYRDGGIWRLDTLVNAVNKVPEGGEIVILRNISHLNTELFMPAKGITLDLNGYRIRYDEIHVTGDGNLTNPNTIRNGEIVNGGIGVSFFCEGAAVVLDSVYGELGRIKVKNTGKLTLQGKTRTESSLIEIEEGSSAVIAYAEMVYGSNMYDDYRGILIQVSGSLTIRDGYFKQNNGYPMIKVSDNGSIDLQGGYYFSETIKTWFSLISAADRGKAINVGEKISPYLSLKGDNWFTPSQATTPTKYWEVYSGESCVKDINQQTITNSDYASGDTCFRLMKDADSIAGMTLEQAAVVDLNNHTAALNAGTVSLSSIVLKNGQLDTTKSSEAGDVTLANGIVESDVVIRAKGTVTLTGMTLEHGVVFYIAKDQSDAFYKDYVASKMDFGGTVIEKKAALTEYTRYRVEYPSVESAVIFHANYPAGSGGTEPDSEKVVQKEDQAYSFPSFMAPPGYDFDHWNVEAAGTGERVTEKFTYKGSAVKHLYAVWHRKNVNVTFDRNGGEWKDVSSLGVMQGAQTVGRTVAYNSALGTLPVASRTGYGFGGWYTTRDSGGSQVMADTKATDNETYYARWIPADGTKYTVIWQGEDVNGSPKVFGQADRFGTTGETVTIASLDQGFDGYSCSGYTIKDSANQQGTTGTVANETFTILADGSVEVTLNYVLNKKQITVTAKKKDTLGSTEDAYSGVQVALSQQGHVTAAGSVDNGSNMSTGSDGTAVTYYKCGSSVTLEAPKRQGYTFVGWSGTYTAANTELRFRMPDKDVAVVALYRQNAYAAGKDLSHILVGAEESATSAQGSQTALTAAGIPYGYTYILKLTAQEGYELPERITLQRGEGGTVVLTAGTGNIGNASYTRESDKKNGVVTVTNVTDNLRVTAEAAAKVYPVSFEGTNVTSNLAENVTVRHGTSFIMSLKAAEGYELPDMSDGSGAALTVVMGEETLTAENGYIYHPADGSVYIEKVTGEVKISAQAQSVPSSYQVLWYQQNADGSYRDTPDTTERFFDQSDGSVVRAGDTVSLLQDDSLKEKYAKTYRGYSFDKTAKNNVTDGVVGADDSLTLKLYYSRNTYTVSIADGYTWADGTTNARTYRFGESVELEIPEKNGCDAGWKGSDGGMGGLSGEVLFSMPAKDIVITPSYRPQEIAVSEAGLTNVRFTKDTELTAYYETAYSAVIEPLDGYSLPQEIAVRIDQKTFTEGFTYDQSTGNVSIEAAKVTGTIEIVAAGEQQTKSATIVFENNLTEDGKAILTASPQSAQVDVGNAFNADIIVAEHGYALPEYITVTMGGKTLKPEEDYIYSGAAGWIRVPDVAADVVITVSPEIERQTADYQVQHYKEKTDGTYTRVQSVRKQGIVGETLDVSDGQNNLIKNYTGYTYDGTVDGSVTSAPVQEDGSTVLRLYYKRKTCTLTLSAETGITATAQSTESGAAGTAQPDGRTDISFKYGENVTASVSGTAAGHSFAGWYQGGEEKGRTDSYSMVITEDMVLTAKSKQASYELVVNGLHGKSNLENNFVDEIDPGTEKTVMILSDTGYHLPNALSLLVDGTETDAYTYTKESEASGRVNLTVNGNSQIYFEAEANRYKLILDANGGKVKINENDAETEQTEMEAVYDTAYGNLPTPARLDYTFLGWFSEKDNADGEQITGETVHLTVGDRTIYAHWKADPVSKPASNGSKPNDPAPDESEPESSDTAPMRQEKPKPETSQPQMQPETPEAQPQMQPEIPETQPEVLQQKPAEQPEAQPEESVRTVPMAIEAGKIVIEGELVATGNVRGMNSASTRLEAGKGAVIVKVVCEEKEFTAGVADTVAVANAVLTPEQIQLVNGGETIEIRVDVRDISQSVAKQDQEVIEKALAQYREEMPDLTVGLYIDVSMFMKVGAGDWNAVTAVKEPIAVVIGIPDELQAGGGKFYIIRAHEGAYDLLADMDDAPDTVTINTDKFSVYAIAYEQTKEAEENHKCGLCHICPTFLGICCFIWLAIIIAVIILMIIILRRRDEEEAKEEKKDRTAEK